jgi:hypothetical protein
MLPLIHAGVRNQGRRQSEERRSCTGVSPAPRWGYGCRSDDFYLTSFQEPSVPLTHRALVRLLRQLVMVHVLIFLHLLSRFPVRLTVSRASTETSRAPAGLAVAPRVMYVCS